MSLYGDIKENTEKSILLNNWHKRLFYNFENFKTCEKVEVSKIGEDPVSEFIIIKRNECEYKISRHKKLIRELKEPISKNIEIECIDRDNGRDKIFLS